MAGIIGKMKKFPKYGTLSIFPVDYEALSPAAFKVLREIRLSPEGGLPALDIAWQLRTTPNSVRRRISELREHGYIVISERGAFPFSAEHVYYVRD